MIRVAFPYFLTTVLVYLFLLSPAVQAQVFWSETFNDESTATSNWMDGGVNNGPATWTWTNDPSAGHQDPDLPAFASTTASDGYFYFDSDYNGLVPHDVWLTGSGTPVDCSGKNDVQLRFFTQYIYFSPAGTIAQLGVSTDGVNFVYRDLFAGLQANLPYHDWVDLDLDEADNQPQVWLQFRWIGNYEYHWKIDDLALSTPPVYNADTCDTAVDISPYFGQTPDVPQITGLFDNTDATVSDTDPEVSCWNEVGADSLDLLNTTMWFTFTGDGGTYDIQTVPCNATNYIGTAQNDVGDTQMLLFSGENCSDLTAVQCNDDLFPSGIPDWRAGLTLQTSPGQNYYLLIDAFENQGVVATGEFCIQITQKPSIPCAQGEVGAFTLADNGFLCQGENLQDILNVDSSGFVLPTISPQSGLAWCFSQAPIPANTWPGSIPDISSTPFSTEISMPFLLNNSTTLDYGVYYLTPVVLGGGSLINTSGLPYVFNVNPDSGCYFVGASQKLTLLPALSPLSVTTQVTSEQVPPGNNGAIILTPGGGSGAYLNDPMQYQYLWSNGQNTKNINGLAAGTFTVTISDFSGCVVSLVQQVTVQQTVGSSDPALVQYLAVRPNPSTGIVQLDLQLTSAADLRYELRNMLGQTIEFFNAGKTQTLNHRLDMSNLAEGLYWLRLTIDQESAQRLILIQR